MFMCLAQWIGIKMMTDNINGAFTVCLVIF